MIILSFGTNKIPIPILLMAYDSLMVHAQLIIIVISCPILSSKTILKFSWYIIYTWVLAIYMWEFYWHYSFANYQNPTMHNIYYQTILFKQPIFGDNISWSNGISAFYIITLLHFIILPWSHSVVYAINFSWSHCLLNSYVFPIIIKSFECTNMWMEFL